MAIVKKEVEIAKEIDDVLVMVVEIVKFVKEGKGLSEIQELIDEAISAISGIDQVDDEFEANRGAVINTALLRVNEIVDVLTKKKEEEQGEVQA